MTAMEMPRNLTEAVDVYHSEMEAVRHQYRWMYERKRVADAQELQQSIKRYKENAQWLTELMSPETPSRIAQRNEELGNECEQQRKDVRERYRNLFAGQPISSSKMESKEESVPENGRHRKRGREESSLSRSPSLSITPVTLPESEWLFVVQRTASKPSIQLRPT